MRGLLLLLLALPAGAFPDCLTDPATKKPREDFDSLRACQKGARAAYGRKDKKGRAPSATALERFEEHQRAEAKRFFDNPFASAGSSGGGSTLVDSPDAPAPEALAEAPAPRARPKGRPGGLSGEDRAKAGEGAKELPALESRLKASAGNGADGITPAMARDIIAHLEEAQGGVSEDLQGLLEAVSRDGGKLAPDTMRKLQDAARAAKEAGLPLGLDPKIERGLLESDFSQDEAPGARPSPGAD